VEHVTIVEIEPLVPQAAEAYFSKENFSVVESPKARLRILQIVNFRLNRIRQESRLFSSRTG